MTYEKPNGLKANLLNSYQTGPLSTDFYDSCPKQDKLFKQMLYSLTFFDVIVNERKNYGNIGWNVAYEFNLSDFTQSIRQLQTFLCNGKPTPFRTLQYIVGECFYGGRIVDEFDNRLLKTILGDIFNEAILDGPPFKFKSIDTHTLPLRFEHRLVLKFIEDNISEQSTCNVYGLHENSEFNFKLKTSNELLRKMQIAMTIEVINEFSETDFLERVKKIRDQLPEPIDMDVTDRFEFSYNNSLNLVLTTEMKLFNRLLCLIQQTCIELEQSINGSKKLCLLTN